jgi:hypothetical protein
MVLPGIEQRWYIKQATSVPFQIYHTNGLIRFDLNNNGMKQAEGCNCTEGGRLSQEVLGAICVHNVQLLPLLFFFFNSHSGGWSPN